MYKQIWKRFFELKRNEIIDHFIKYWKTWIIIPAVIAYAAIGIIAMDKIFDYWSGMTTITLQWWQWITGMSIITVYIIFTIVLVGMILYVIFIIPFKWLHFNWKQAKRDVRK